MSFSIHRLAAGFTLDEVSTEFGVPSDAVREWEEGRAQPPPHVSRSLKVIGDFRAPTAADGKLAPVVSAKACHPWTASRARSPSRKRLPMSKPQAQAASLIKSKKRVADHGEVFTPPWLVEKMLDLVKGESERIDSRFLEPACGSGNFLVPILQRKLAAVELKYGRSEFEKRQYALYALSCLYGIELLADNIAECRANMLDVFASYLGLEPSDDLYRAASHILSANLIHGDAMTMKAADGSPITVVEWSYLGKGKFNRRDFRLDVLTGMSKFSEERSLFAHLGKHEIFQPADSYPPMAVPELAARDVSE
jgi:hypothetical protein